MKIGILEKASNITVHTYVYHRLKNLPQYSSNQYAQYVIETGTSHEQYIWSEEENKVIINPNYIAVSIDYTPKAIEAVRKATEFGYKLSLEFAGQNVVMDILKSGKTKAVADYLANLDRYLKSGTLYEAIAEIDSLQNQGLPEELNPFVTEERLEIFKNKIKDYLQI